MTDRSFRVLHYQFRIFLVYLSGKGELFLHNLITNWLGELDQFARFERSSMESFDVFKHGFGFLRLKGLHQFGGCHTLIIRRHEDIVDPRALVLGGEKE